MIKLTDANSYTYKVGFVQESVTTLSFIRQDEHKVVGINNFIYAINITIHHMD